MGGAGVDAGGVYELEKVLKVNSPPDREDRRKTTVDYNEYMATSC
jgi:hypothetical protein